MEKFEMRKVRFFCLVVGFFALVTSSCAVDEWENGLYGRIAPSPVDGGYADANYWVWGSSVVKGDDGLYHMFVSRWPKRLPFHPGWMVESEVVHCISKTPEGPYQFSDVALEARGAQFWDGQSTHNPRVMKHGDTYVMFYMGSTHPFEDVSESEKLTLDSHYTVVARSNKRIGVATSKSPYGPWQRHEEPVLDTKPNSFYSFLTSNPSPWIHEDGSVLLIFKSRQYKSTFPYQSHMTIGVAKANHYNGPYEVVVKEAIFGLEKVGEIEDPFLWKDENGYHLIAKDQRGTITKLGYRGGGVLAHSHDGVAWMLDETPLAYEKKIHWDNGETILQGQLERPFGLIEDGQLTHLFFATMDGPGGFGNSTKSWNLVVPLKKN